MAVNDYIYCLETEPKGNKAMTLKCSGYRMDPNPNPPNKYRFVAMAELGDPQGILNSIDTCENYDTLKRKYPFHKPEKFIDLLGYFAIDPYQKLARGLPRKMMLYILDFLREKGYEFLILNAATTRAEALAATGLAKVYVGQFGMDLLGGCIDDNLLSIQAALGMGNKEFTEYITESGQELPIYYVGLIDEIRHKIRNDIKDTIAKSEDIVDLQSTKECIDFRGENISAEDLKRCYHQRKK